MSSKGSILIVSTSHDKLGNSGKPTGCWVEELAVPYYIFKDAGYAVTVASIAGGEIPFDPNSLSKDTASTEYKFMKLDDEAKAAWQKSKPISGLSMDSYVAIYVPGGHGIVFDGSSSTTLKKLLEEAWTSDKIVSSVCHGPGALTTAKGADGKSILNGKQVTGFSNTEEDGVQLTQYVPFLLEDKLKELGGHYSKSGDWQSHVVADGNLITGQNPGSSKAVAEAVLQKLGA